MVAARGWRAALWGILLVGALSSPEGPPFAEPPPPESAATECDLLFASKKRNQLWAATSLVFADKVSEACLLSYDQGDTMKELQLVGGLDLIRRPKGKFNKGSAASQSLGAQERVHSTMMHSRGADDDERLAHTLRLCELRLQRLASDLAVDERTPPATLDRVPVPPLTRRCSLLRARLQVRRLVHKRS